MVNVAVLGGSGHVGKTIVQVMSECPNHPVIVLCRKIPQDVDPAVTHVAIDYSNQASLVSIFEKYEIHTVISCLGVWDGNIAKAQCAAIDAAEQSAVTKRFIASNWGPPSLPKNEQMAIWFPYQIAALAHLRTTSLEFTEIATGYFLDYWGMPNIKTNMASTIVAIDIANGVAAIPGTGNEPISFIYTFDLARVVARMLDLPPRSWEEITYVLADKLTWNEFLPLAEAARGFKFQVGYDGVQRLSRGEITELPNHRESYSRLPKPLLQEVYSSLGLMMAQGVFDLEFDKAINNSFPDIKTRTVKETLQEAWRGKEGRSS